MRIFISVTLFLNIYIIISTAKFYVKEDKKKILIYLNRVDGFVTKK